MKLNGNNIQLCTPKVPILPTLQYSKSKQKLKAPKFQYISKAVRKYCQNEIFLSDFQTL